MLSTINQTKTFLFIEISCYIISLNKEIIRVSCNQVCEITYNIGKYMPEKAFGGIK